MVLEGLYDREQPVVSQLRPVEEQDLEVRVVRQHLREVLTPLVVELLERESAAQESRVVAAEPCESLDPRHELRARQHLLLADVELRGVRQRFDELVFELLIERQHEQFVFRLLVWRQEVHLLVALEGGAAEGAYEGVRVPPNKTEKHNDGHTWTGFILTGFPLYMYGSFSVTMVSPSPPACWLSSSRSVPPEISETRLLPCKVAGGNGNGNGNSVRMRACVRAFWGTGEEGGGAFRRSCAATRALAQERARARALALALAQSRAWAQALMKTRRSAYLPCPSGIVSSNMVRASSMKWSIASEPILGTWSLST